MEDADDSEFTPFRKFTRESLFRIEQRLAEERAAKIAEEAESDDDEEPTHQEEPRKPNEKLEAGKKVPPSLEDYFTPEFCGTPLEDIDEFYQNQKSFCVIGKDKSIFRFSATNAFFVLSPFNTLRRASICILVHPLFSALVILTIIVNCIFMTFTETPGGDITEYVFTAIYTVEAFVKMSARGYIIQKFTYLRDPWNWLDFGVIAIAYVQFGFDSLGNLSVLRTFRVLRALKTVAVIPGLKTIVGALLEAVIRLRDVGILTSFVLSIFALIGMQLYMGTLRSKCVLFVDPAWNFTHEEYHNWTNNEGNWFIHDGGDYLVCGNASSAGQCPEGYVCKPKLSSNPNHNYTAFDNFGMALLCAFRLMTQDYWENLYMLVLRAEGLWHSIYFILVILMGSFYLVNLILAIVAMSYDEQQKADKLDAEEKVAERETKIDHLREELEEMVEEMTKSPSIMSCGSDGPYSPDKVTEDRISVQSEKHTQDRDHLLVGRHKASFSLPGSPYVKPRRSKPSRISLKIAKQLRHHAEKQPLVHLESLNLPYADDSNAVTPCSEDIRLCNLPTKFSLHRASLTSSMRQAKGEEGLSRRGSNTSQASWTSRSRLSPHSPIDKMSMLETAFNMKNKTHRLLPEVVVDRAKYGDNEFATEQHCSQLKGKDDYHSICRTPRGSHVDQKDVKVLRDLLEHVETASRRSLHSLSVFSYTQEPLKDRLNRILCSWQCPPPIVYIQKAFGFIILDPFVDLFITLCIVGNTVFMAMDYHGMSEDLRKTVEDGNQMFSLIFAIEAVCKIIALGFIVYIRDGWNAFDFLIVCLSCLELLMEGVKGLSVLRSFRLLRVFKLAKSWPTLNMLISIVARTLGALGNLTFVLAIVIFIFAVMGQQLFAPNYQLYLNETMGTEGIMPRWNFTDFLHSFMIVFRVLCGEWIESMWACMLVAGWPCVPFFLLTMIIGNLVVLNLFLALLLSSFGTENLQTEGEGGDTAPNKLAEAFDRFSRFGTWVKVLFIVLVKRSRSSKRQRNITEDKSVIDVEANGKNGACITDGSVIGMNGTACEILPEENGHITPSTKTALDGEAMEMSEASTRTPSQSSDHRKSVLGTESETSMSEDGETQSLHKVDAEGEPEINEVDVEFAEYPDDCFCHVVRQKCTCCITLENTCAGRVWWKWRCFFYKVTQHKYFETFIITMIITSSLALALEDVNLPDRPILKAILMYMDKVFTIVFILEMLIKWFAFGFKKYYTDAWCWLDFVIVLISLVMIAASSVGMEEVGAFKAMRTLRALRPLRAVSRWEGMRVVVNALIKAIPSIANVLLVCIVFWLIFGIVGVQMFAGKFFKCVDEYGIKLNNTIVPNRNVCESMTESHNYTWVNAPINFDHVFNAYLALFQVATYKGWIEIMNDAIDVPAEVDMQPSREISLAMYIYFVLFIVFGSFFTLNLFIGVIIENFNNQKKKAGGSLEMLMTEDQKKYYHAMKRMAAKQPIKAIPRPNAGGSLEMFMTEDQKKYYKAMKRMAAKQPIKAIPRPKAGSLDMFMTEDQKKYYMAMKRMQAKSPQKSIPRPTWFPGGIMYDVTTSQKFDIIIMIVIMMNMCTMTMEHYGQTDQFTLILYWINFSFIVIFTIECVMKLTGLRHFYFKIPWNVFDFIVVILSLLGLALSEYIEEYFVSPTLLRVVRVFRVGRVLRLVKSAKGIRTLLFSLAVSIPALFNIGLLLFLVLFIYAIFGMNFFMNVKIPVGGLDDVFNFQTFGQSIITLFQMCTSAGWAGVLKGLTNYEDCVPDGKNMDACGNSPMAVFYLLTYLVISFLVVVNMYIAVILENFSQATEDVQQGLTPDDFDMYYEKWEKYDPKATQYIPLASLSDFIDYLEEPLRLQKPNYFMLVKLDIAICEGDMCYCRDILDALTKNFLGTSDTGDIPTNQEGSKPSKIEYIAISSTLMRQKEQYAARIIQKAFRNYRVSHDGDEDKKPPPYDEIAINIEEDGDKDTEDKKILMTDEKQDEKKKKVKEEATPEQTIVEVDLQPDSNIVA